MNASIVSQKRQSLQARLVHLRQQRDYLGVRGVESPFLELLIQQQKERIKAFEKKVKKWKLHKSGIEKFLATGFEAPHILAKSREMLIKTAEEIRAF